MRRLFQRFTSSAQERSVSMSPEAGGFSNGTNSPTPHGFGHTEMASTAELDIGAMANFLPEFVLSVEFASDPSAWETQLDKSWTKLEELLTMSDRRVGNDALDKVCELLSTICHLLVMEVNSQSEPSIGPILDQFFNEEILLQVLQWAHKIPSNSRPKCQMMLVRLYEYMLLSSQCPQSLLVHKPILMPLLQLLQWCRRSSVDEQRSNKRSGGGGNGTATQRQQQKQQHCRRHEPMAATGVERCFVRLINQICRKIAADDTLLHFFFHSSVLAPLDFETTTKVNAADDNNNNSSNNCGVPTNDDENAARTESAAEQNEGKEKPPFLVFDLLVPYLYAPEDVGQLARDALLLIISLSEQHQFVADYVAQKVNSESNFCPVLAAGLSACFSQLPHCIFTELGVVDTDDFHKLSVMDAKTLPELCEFHNALLFCNAVATVAHVSIVRQIVRFFYDGFLLEVFKSSVLESDVHELCSRIVYLHLCLDTVRAPSLVRALVKLLVVAETDRPDGWNLLEVLLSKMNTSDRLCRVTLSLLRTLLSLRCEDLLWCAVFRHLMPYIPLNKATRRPNQSRRFDINVSLDAATFFLKCVPECTRRLAELYSEEQFEAYMREAGDAIRECASGCAGWRFKYDGVSPNVALLNMSNPSDELLSARQPFVRMCSARSSFASTGWNRYFQNRSAHGTLSAEGDGATADAIQSLNELGKDDDGDELGHNNNTSLSQEEDFNDFNLHYDEMTAAGAARLDYFQFAYEGVSESSDGPDSVACSRRNSQESGGEDEGRNAAGGGGQPNSLPSVVTVVSSPSQSSSLSAAPTTLSARSRMMDAIVATEWSTMNGSREQFIEMLNALPDQEDEEKAAIAGVPSRWSPVPKRARTTEENIALIESRWQYLEELRMEREASASRKENDAGGDEHNPFRLDLSETTTAPEINNGIGEQRRLSTGVPVAEERMNDDQDDGDKNNNHQGNNSSDTGDGFPMECVDGMGAGILLESVFEALSRLTEHTFATNLQLIGALNALFAYSQPLLTTYLLYVDALKSRALCRITNLIADLKEQIDAFARNGSPSGAAFIGDAAADFEQMVRRAVRHRQTRAERSERLLLHRHHQQNGTATAGPTKSPAAAASSPSAWSAAARSQQQQHQPMSSCSSAAASGGGGTFRFTHRAMASAERGHAEEQERTRNFAYAAIAHSQLCLLMAAFALQHSAAVEYPRGVR